jgi:hypothetical protein
VRPHQSIAPGEVFRVGLSEAHYSAEQGLTLEARRFGRSSAYVCSANGTLRVDLSEMRGLISDILNRAATAANAEGTGAVGCVSAIADALTALRVAVVARKGLASEAKWWRRHYFELVSQEHRKLWPKTPVPMPPWERQPKSTGPRASVVSLKVVRQHRAAQRAAAAESAAQAERQRIAAATRVEPSGQIAAAF